MPNCCSNCKLKFELENGFWWGTGYVNYAVSVLISIITFFVWFFTIGFTLEFYIVYLWLACNGVFILIIQPWIMRLGRSIYIHFFVSFKENEY